MIEIFAQDEPRSDMHQVALNEHIPDVRRASRWAYEQNSLRKLRGLPRRRYVIVDNGMQVLVVT